MISRWLTRRVPIGMHTAAGHKPLVGVLSLGNLAERGGDEHLTAEVPGRDVSGKEALHADDSRVRTDASRDTVGEVGCSHSLEA